MELNQKQNYYLWICSDINKHNANYVCTCLNLWIFVQSWQPHVIAGWENNCCYQVQCIQLTSPFPNVSFGGSSFIQKNHSHGDGSIYTIVVKETMEMLYKAKRCISKLRYQFYFSRSVKHVLYHNLWTVNICKKY